MKETQMPEDINNVQLRIQGQGIPQTMKQIRPENKGEDNKKHIPLMHAYEVTTKGMSSYQEERKFRELLQNLYLQKGKWGISLLLDLIEQAPHIDHEDEGQQQES